MGAKDVDRDGDRWFLIECLTLRSDGDWTLMPDGSSDGRSILDDGGEDDIWPFKSKNVGSLEEVSEFNSSPV